ncbi:hypothetical protein SSPO_089160 [Streptomyces antimycoticus]|uniref:Uncharacterized protein n=1 Tax=Streptomyces antimycoticus TaxID=68175 RepID=A0A4D4K0M0_9ACTN|nr:hypothetical protein SSPO_089160 [Streptomyces antimycoticus]GDY40236.1 hypothetical protein SANT12839_011180 [Streptomyces antimycoticus]
MPEFIEDEGEQERDREADDQRQQREGEGVPPRRGELRIVQDPGEVGGADPFGDEPGVYFWKAITTARIAGYQENSAKQTRPPRRKP